MPESIHHVAVVVKDIEKGAAFYRNVFGFGPLKRLTARISTHGGAWFQVGDLELHLQERKEDTQKTDQHFAMVTTRFDELLNNVLAQGGTWEEARLIEGYSKRCFIYDLDRNRIELLER